MTPDLRALADRLDDRASLVGWPERIPIAAALRSAADTIDAQRAEIERQWQPIETAPRDVEVLLYCPDRGIANRERMELREFHSTRGGFSHAWATHWMPLPKAPT